MPRYANGRAPLSDLVKLADQHYLPVGTAARWREMQRLAWEKYGVWLVITPGWNGYRPLDVQIQYRKELGIWAAVPGYSSHGLTYQGRDCAAIDVNNWGALAPGNESLAWARFVTLCRIVGFIVDFVSPRELWHIGDYDPFTVPAFASIVINPGTTNRPTLSEEDDMLALNIDAGPNGLVKATLGPGIFRHLIQDDDPEWVKNVVRTDDEWTHVPLSRLPVLLRTYGCDLNIWAFVDGKFAVLNPDDGSVRPGNMWHR